MKSSDNPDSLRGEGLKRLVIDECAQVKEEAWKESLRPALADKLGWAIFIGTPKKRNWFFHLFKQAEKLSDWSTFTFSTYDNPYIDVNEIEQMKLTMSDKEFRQEVMAEFVSDEGYIFKKEWFARYNPLPNEIYKTFISWDTAGSVSDDAAYSAGVVGHILKDYRLSIVDVWRKRVEFPQLQYGIEEQAQKYIKSLDGIVIENKSSGIAVIQSLRQTSKAQIGDLIWAFEPKGKKEERAYTAAKWCEKGMVTLPEYADNPWLVDYEDELFSFPDSEYKDQTDATAQLIEFCSNYLEAGLQSK